MKTVKFTAPIHLVERVCVVEPTQEWQWDVPKRLWAWMLRLLPAKVSKGGTYKVTKESYLDLGDDGLLHKVSVPEVKWDEKLEKRIALSISYIK